MEEIETTETLENNFNQQHLPHDLVAQHILTRLPIKSLIKFKSVSKQWYFTLSSQQFAYTQFKLCPVNHSNSPTQFLFIQNRSNYYIFSYCDDDEILNTTANSSTTNLMKLGISFPNDELVLIGSCNGLVCLASFSEIFFILWNPITGHFCKYSDPDLLIDSNVNSRVSWGFGYVSFVDDYKIVRILELSDNMEIRVHVFSLKTKKWTRIDDEIYQDSFQFPVSFYSRQGVLVNETLYWIVLKKNDLGRKVVAFDLVHERFDSIFNMKLVSNAIYSDKFLCVMGGCLSKFGVNIRDDIHIEILSGPEKVERIRLSRDLRVRSCRSIVGYTRNGGFFILLEDSTIGIVDPTSQPMKYTPVLTFESLGKSRVTSYAPSLTSPYDVA